MGSGGRKASLEAILLGHGGQQNRQHSSLRDKWFILKTLDGGWRLLFSFYFEVTVLAKVAVVRCYLRTEPTNLSSSRRQEIDKVILVQIILLFRVLFVGDVTLRVYIPPGTTAVSYYKLAASSSSGPDTLRNSAFLFPPLGLLNIWS